MSEDSLKALDFDTLMCFVHGLIQVAKVDGIQPKEKEYIEAFLNEELSHIDPTPKVNFDDLVNDNFDKTSIERQIKNEELKVFFLTSCVMLACVDEFTDAEKELINEYSGILNYSKEDLDKIILNVQNQIMDQFKDITIYSDSLEDIAQSIGVERA